MKPGEWRLVDAEESVEPIPGRPQYVERRVVKTYRAPFVTGGRLLLGCPCSENVSLDLSDGAETKCRSCGRTYRLDLAVVRVDDEKVPPAGMGK